MPTGSKLAVILHADVVGSTALVQLDEAVAHDRIQAAFQRSSSVIAEFGGTTHELRGDALVAEFERASDAVSASLALQAVNRDANESLGDEIRPWIRIGISLGEVIVADSTLTGPGVVLAQRVEQLAEAGGVVVTEAIREAVPGRLPFEYVDRGTQALKGFSNPVHAYSVLLRAGAEVPVPAEATSRSRRVETPMWRSRTWAVGVTLVAAVVAAGAALWFHTWQTDPPATSSMPPPDRPSIAVLPFANVSNDADQEYFADGLTDDLITDLSNLSGLFVVSRNSVFTFKDNAARAEDVARELGVHFVLEGNIRRASDRIRVNARLVNGSTGRHVWAQRYDREITDIFRVQDELVSQIVRALAVQLTPAEQQRVTQKPTRSLEAYKHFLQAREGYFTGELPRLRQSIHHFQRAIELDDEFAEAYSGLAMLAVDVWRFDHLVVANAVVARKLAEDSATRALDLDPTLSQAHSVLALLRMVDGQHEFAQQLAQRATELAPNSADAYATLAVVLGYGGRVERALDAIRMAVRLNPRPPVNMLGIYGWVLFMNREYDAAIAILEPIVDDSNPPFGDSPMETLAMAYAQAGHLEKARSSMQIARRNLPFVNLAYYRLLYSHHARGVDVEHRIDALRLAGVPELGVGFEGDPTHRLDEDGLRELVAAGQAWQGTDMARDQPFVQEFLDEGKVVYGAQTTMMSGTYTVRNGQLCERFEISTFGRDACGHVYRNEGGSLEARNQYTYVNPIALRTFSAVR